MQNGSTQCYLLQDDSVGNSVGGLMAGCCAKVAAQKADLGYRAMTGYGRQHSLPTLPQSSRSV
jgi:hypothetical protein